MTNEEIIQGNEINRLNYWEHFKKAKDLALVFPPEHPERKRLDSAMREILEANKLVQYKS